MTSPHFLTTRNETRLFLALLASLLLHILPFVPGLIPSPTPTPPPPPIAVSLRPPPVEAPPPPPPLTLPEQPKPAPAKPPPEKRPPPEKPAKTPKTWTQAVNQHLKKLNDAGQFYPEEARRQGIEGEALVLIIIDESGHIVGSRIEESSGHAILDQAALRNVRLLRSELPPDAPREALLPVRFRLR